MKQLTVIFLVLCFVLPSAQAQSDYSIEFNNQTFLLRAAPQETPQLLYYEFTPENQKDLMNWQEMLTFQYYPQADTPKKRKKVAQLIAGGWKSYEHGNLIMSYHDQKKDEYYFSAFLGLPGRYIEYSLARVVNYKNTTAVIIYGRRAYEGDNSSKKPPAVIADWVSQNRQYIIKALRKLPDIPSPIDLSEALKSGK